jgi:hypothetical protein
MQKLTLPARPERADALASAPVYLFLDLRDGAVSTGTMRERVTTGLRGQVWIWRLPDRVDAYALDEALHFAARADLLHLVCGDMADAPRVAAVLANLPTPSEEAACESS